MTTDTTIRTIDVEGVGPVQLTVEERGEGRPYLVLHGGAGPQSVSEFVQLLAEKDHNRAITPTHPGFGGTTRPEALDGVPKLATLYRGLLDELGLEDVTVVGNSVGGWIAAELALLGSPRISRMVLLDAVGIEVEVATTRSPAARAASVNARPNPRDAPVMNHVCVISHPNMAENPCQSN
jgi:pimeloyl-ACP methyl ester carboxylesterase